MNKENRLLGACKYCNEEIFGFHPNKFQAHQRFCVLNPTRNKAINQLKSFSTAGNIAASKNKKAKALIDNEKHEHACKCVKCGNDYIVVVSDKAFVKGYFSKHCSTKCSNSRVFTEASRKLIGRSVSKEHIHICPTCGKEFTNKGTSPNALCDSCKPIQNVQQYDKDSKKIVSKETRIKLSNSVQEHIKNGTHKGWKVRPIESYPEKFWKQVLDNNNIKYEFNYYIQKKSLGLSDNAGYFLDFKLKDNIDLEIDGKQHLCAERKKSDIIRDNALIANDWKVYRIAWNEINSDAGKELMKQKIDKFLNWYN